jgi:hypothetical protein
MGLWDIVYDIIKDYRTAQGNEILRKNLAISICKKAYLRFYFEWNTEIDSKRIENFHDAQKNILFQYSQLFLDIAVEIFDTLPEESDKLKELSQIMKKGAYSNISHDSPRIIPQGTLCAKEGLKRVEVLNSLVVSC